MGFFRSNRVAKEAKTVAELIDKRRARRARWDNLRYRWKRVCRNVRDWEEEVQAEYTLLGYLFIMVAAIAVPFSFFVYYSNTYERPISRMHKDTACFRSCAELVKPIVAVYHEQAGTLLKCHCVLPSREVRSRVIDQPPEE